MPQVATPAAPYLWPAWIALTLILTGGPFLWHLRYFRSPGPPFLPLYLAALTALGAASWFYLGLRRRRPEWMAREPRLLLIFFLAFFLIYAPLPTLYGLWIGLVCFSLGRAALPRLAESPLEQLTLWPAAGLGLLSAGMFVLGLAGLYHRWLILALLAVAGALGWRNLSRLAAAARGLAAGYAAAAAGTLPGLCLIFASIFAWTSALVALSPEIAFDPVSFHFVFAREYAQSHRLLVVPRLPYSYFPQNVEILYTLGFLLEGQQTAKIITYSYFPLAALSLALIGRRWFSPRAGLIGASLFWTTPFIAWTGSVAKNDLALALYLLLALYGTTRWIDEKDFRWLAAGVLFLGFAFGVKHVAALGAAPLAVLVVWNLRRAPLRARQVVALAAIFVGLGLYWHIRTWILTGDPLYPESASSAVRSTTASGHPHLSRLDRAKLYLSFPWRIHFQGLHAFESPSSNPVGFFLVAFLPLLALRGGIRCRGARVLLLFCVAYFLYWAAILTKVRYSIAAFGLLFVYLADRLDGFCRSGSALRRQSAVALACYCFVFSLSLTLILEMNAPRLALFARRIGPQQFLRETLITYRSMEAMNRVARPGELAYSVGNCSTFYSTIEFHCYYDHEGNYLIERVARDLRETHYQYLIVSNQWAEPRHMAVVEHYYQAELLHHDQAFRLYRLRRRG